MWLFTTILLYHFFSYNYSELLGSKNILEDTFLKYVEISKKKG